MSKNLMHTPQPISNSGKWKWIWLKNTTNYKFCNVVRSRNRCAADVFIQLLLLLKTLLTYIFLVGKKQAGSLISRFLSRKRFNTQCILWRFSQMRSPMPNKNWWLLNYRCCCKWETVGLRFDRCTPGETLV